MKLNLLGTCGVAPIPRPTCNCRLCAKAREKGIPYSRTGPSLYVNDASLLFDTPEDIREQLNRENIPNLKNIILTHWHPDHTLGIRIIEQINMDFDKKKSHYGPINVYISKKQYELFKKFSCGGFLDFYASKGLINLNFLEDGEVLKINNVEITPVIIEETQGFYYYIRDVETDKRAVYAPCEYKGLKVREDVRNVDLFIAHNLFWEDSSISPRESVPTDEDTFEKMLCDADEMNAKKIIITHIEESFQLDHDDLIKVFKEKFSKYDLMPGYDGQIFDL